MNDLENPWVGAESFTEKFGKEFVLRIDAEQVEAVRARQKNPHLQLQVHVPPEPWCGPITSASVLILSGNPRWNSADEGMPTRAHELMLSNLSGDQPMFWLLQEMDSVSGSNWYKTRLLNRVIEIIPREKVARHLCQVDFYGYRSENWDSSLSFASQAFTFAQVREAMGRGAALVVTMAWRQWMEAVPELASYPLAFRNSSWQNKTLSESNTRLKANGGQAEGFAAVIDALKTAAQ